MLKKRGLFEESVLSVRHPCLSGDVQRCWRWPGQRLFHIALHGSVLIKSGHGPLSGGYTGDAVPSDQTVAECDSGKDASIMNHICTKEKASGWIVRMTGTDIIPSCQDLHHSPEHSSVNL